MPGFLLDTSVIVDVLNGKKGRPELLRGLVSQGHLLGCSPVNVAEVYAGMRPNEERSTSQLLRSLQYCPITFEIAELAGRLRREHKRQGVTLSIADTLIAAVAMHNQLTLITDNVKHFPMKELALYALPR